MITQFDIPIIFLDSKTHTIHQRELLNALAFMERFHPLPVVDANRFAQIKEETERLCAEIGDSREMNLAGFQARFNEWLALWGDAHSFVMLDDDEAYPYSLRFYHGDFYFYSLSTLYPDCTGIAIHSINGVTAKNLAQRLERSVPSENVLKACITGSFFMNSPQFLRSIGIPDDEGLHFTLADGRELVVQKRPHPCSCGNHLVKITPHPVTGRRTQAFHYQIVGDICYFQMNAMYDRFSYLQGCRLMQTAPDEALANSLPSFVGFLNEMSDSMNTNRVHTLVIDLRHNGGGNSLLGDLLLKFLGVDLGSIKRYRSYVRISDFLKASYPGYIRPERLPSAGYDGLADPNLIAGDSITMPHIGTTFSGDVHFIQGQNTFSSANYLLTTIKDNALFPTIGSPTSQKPTCFGDVLPVTWPLTRTKGYVSFGYFERPCRENTETTLPPDTLVQETLDEHLSGTDRCWDILT